MEGKVSRDECYGGLKKAEIKVVISFLEVYYV